jgi:hypothetical protein
LLAARCHNQRAPFDTPSLDERGSQRVEQAQESAQAAKDRAVDAAVAAKAAAIGTGTAAWHGAVAGMFDTMQSIMNGNSIELNVKDYVFAFQM